MSEQERPGVQQGIVRISHELLAELLHFPEGARIVGVSEHVYFSSNELAIKIEHSALPRTSEGCTLPEVQPAVAESDVGATFDWNGNGLMPGVPSVAMPRADKVAELCTDTLRLLEYLGTPDDIEVVRYRDALRERWTDALLALRPSLHVEAAPLVYQGAPPSCLVETEPSVEPQPNAVVDEPKKVKFREFF